MSGPDRDVSCAEPPAPLTAASPSAINDSSLSASPAQQLQLQPQPQQQRQQTAASEAALAGQPAEYSDQHHHSHGLDNGTNDTNDTNDTNNVTDNESANLPPFEPIFTLLTNNTTNTTVHPRVHYLFSDDDASAVLTAPQTDPSHRALIVDLAPPAAPNGKWTVSWASSLTPDFAITASQLSPQQHGSGGGDGGDGGNDAEAGSTSVVLRVEGVEREGVDSRPNSLPGSGSGIVGREDVEYLTDEFRRRLGVLKKAVDEGERRKEALGRLNEGMHPAQGEDAAPAATAQEAAAVEYDAGGNRVPERQNE